MVKFRNFRSPTDKPVKVFSDDFCHSSLIGNDWTPIMQNQWKAAYAGGCISADMAVRGFDKDQTLAVIEMEQQKEIEAIKQVMRDIIKGGDINKMDRFGKPTHAAIKEKTGKNITLKERTRLYKEVIKE